MNKSGGMALLWNNEANILEVQGTAFTIEVKVEDQEKKESWWLIGIYASCDSQVRRGQWEVLNRRKVGWGDKWIIIGDFNDIISNDEKWGGRRRDNRSFHDFRKFINENQLLDVGYIGKPWTWSNNWYGNGEIKERLDRGLCSMKWSQCYEDAKRRGNRIQKLKKSSGNWTATDEELGKEVADYYGELFKSSGLEGLDDILEGIPVSITEQMNRDLTKEVEEDEIKTAFFSMEPNKAPGSDGMSPLFFQKFWSIIKQDLKAKMGKQLTGVKISRGAPAITHLFFADDSLVFCRANRQEAGKLMNILKVYEKATGQLINMDKSSVFFSKNTTQAVFGYIRNAIDKKLQSWKNKLLSQAGKEVMLKAVAMAMPTYTMSCFRLSSKMCRDISAKMADYWWGRQKERKGCIGLAGER
ncbi:uncharacterized protein [Coffea arabica]|uniref:Reverse transcriptase n=1 Tax=Coffea arabica TaxID=13443 RepID=A0ABM4UY16_COFAR